MADVLQDKRRMKKDHYVRKSLRKKCHGCNKVFSMSRRSRHCRKVDRKQECQRLLKGFGESVSRLGNSKTVQEVRVLMKTPSWQKSKYWEIEVQATKCRSCHVDKGIRKSSGNCRVCGLALCKKCSSKDLLLYINEEDKTRDVRLTIINTKCCPQTEPHLSLLLYTCKSCKDYIIEQQDRDVLWFKDTPKTLQDEIVSFNDQLYPLCEHINSTRKKIEDLLDETDMADLSVKNRNMISVNITKLKERLNEFDVKFKTLRSFTPRAKSRTERRFLRQYTKGKYDYFMENKCKCRAFSNKQENCQQQSKK
ncbi:hypothetical protein ACF0H5_015248 [Mactra antiquata]